MSSWDSNTKLFKTALLSKAERIQFARDNKLNVLEYVAVKSEYEIADVIEKYEACSIRCEPTTIGSVPGDGVEWYKWQNLIDKHDGKWTTPPHFPYVENRDLGPILQSLLRRGWKPIVSDGLAFKDNILSGTLTAGDFTLIYDQYEYIAEFNIGPGCSVRDITHGGTPDMRFVLSEATGTVAEMLRAVAKPFKKQRAYIEWGYESHPVGWKHERLVVWELHLMVD